MNVKSSGFFGCILCLLVVLAPFASWAQGNMRGQLLVNRLSNRCLDVAGAPGTLNGAPLMLYDCERSGMNPNGSPTDQMWEFTPQGFIRNTLSGRCLDVRGEPGTANGAPLILWDCEGDGRSMSGQPTDQRWELLPSGHIRNRLSGRCIDVAGAPGTNNGTRLQLFDCEFNLRVTDQLWTRY